MPRCKILLGTTLAATLAGGTRGAGPGGATFPFFPLGATLGLAVVPELAPQPIFPLKRETFFFAIWTIIPSDKSYFL